MTKPISYLLVDTTKGTRDTIAINSPRYFEAEITLPASAVDTVLTLGACTSPRILSVIAEDGVTFKVGTSGVDVLSAYPAAILSSQQGLGIDRILLSNAGSTEVTVAVTAGD